MTAGLPPGAAILLVEDDVATRGEVATFLRGHGFRVDEAGDGALAWDRWTAHRPDLVVLDLGLPDFDGSVLIRRMRRDATTPILVLSARDREAEKVAALESGADDYVTKPFGMEELLARVRVSLRRARTEASELDPIEAGDFKIDPGARTVFVKERAVHLTPKEFDLLAYMARHAGKVVTHRALLGAVWGGESTEQVEYLRVFVAQLRKKLEPSPNSPRYIVTDPWVGYRFEPGD